MTRILDEPVFWVDPKQLKRTAYMTDLICETYGVQTRTGRYAEARNKLREIGHVSGDWDKKARGFDKEPFLKVLDIYDQKGDITPTKAYKIAIDRYTPGKVKTIFKRWFNIYEDMKVNGWQQRKSESLWNEYVLVCIGRSGELLFYQGRHRLAMALRLGIKSIPVKVGLRHTEWYNFRESIRKYANSHRGFIYSPINHPDFLTFETKWTDYRGDLITRHISKDSKTVLDIGAHWGYFSELLSRNGKDCTAIEKAESMYNFLYKISKFPCKPGFNAVNSGINEFLSAHNKHFDCVIALNIFHHFLKNQAGWDNLVDVAGSLQCNEMFFQMANDKTLTNFGGGWKKTADVLALLIEKTGLKDVNQIGIEHNRPIYHLKRV